ncbi:phosphate acyltransferase PlsX [Facklamia sp. DSM 111018]|uniref:Phosphate acyltransferase n=1 Tax=Facklamia lactis TaxID=2749967 RepID=A0ABS0LN01_9LACT|nr:phosphate acyltransferase PlsX [Facklamia lactis]MBG9979806.1 phosphate acyltransferase PlsX [Facklamia lactis]MBG9985514.1 phosphate acyltransferase PlsX [Facklamia lactis]
MIKLAIDAMGGDNAPQSVVEGVNKALQEFEDLEIHLFGDTEAIKTYLKDNDRVKITETTEIITGEDEPVKAIRSKKDSSMVVAARSVREGKTDVLLSAGNTGALLSAGLLIVGRIKGIDRPGLMPIIPTVNPDSPQFILMDAGANADSKAIQLHQHAILANYYAQNVLGIQKPRIGLLNNGTEEGKGDDLRKEAFDLLNNDPSIHFIGNVEAKELLTGSLDIAITDGFTGNAILKTLEGTAKNIFKVLKDSLMNSGVKTKLGALLVKSSLKSMAEKFDDTKQGGAVLLGVKHPVIKAHGSSDSEAIYNAIRQARQIVDSKAVEKMKEYFNQD